MYFNCSTYRFKQVVKRWDTTGWRVAFYFQITQKILLFFAILNNRHLILSNTYCLAELLEDVSSRRTVQMATEHVLIALKLTEILKPLDLQSKVTPPLYCASEYNGCTSKPVRSGSLRLGLTTWSLTQNILRTSRTGHWVRSLMWRIPTVHLVRSCEPRQISPSVSPESSLSLLTSLR